MTEGPRVNFVCAKRFSKVTRGSSVFHTSMRNKQVEFNPYIYNLSNRAVFRTAAGAAGSYVTYVSSWKNGCQKFSYVHCSRKHWECKYYDISDAIR